jgi:hypothetical protein
MNLRPFQECADSGMSPRKRKRRAVFEFDDAWRVSAPDLP